MSLMELLRNLANEGLPIIQSIHQPSNQIVNIFDKIMIISNGCIVYYGKSDDIESYLNSIEYYLPFHSSSSPVDFLLEALYSDATTPIDGFYHRDILKAKWELHSISNHQPVYEVTPQHIGYQNYPSSSLTRFLALYKREVILTKTKQWSVLEFMETIIVSIITGLAWYQLEPFESEIYDISSFLAFLNSYWMFKSIFSGALEFLPVRKIIEGYIILILLSLSLFISSS